jgi:hypothetical protein
MPWLTLFFILMRLSMLPNIFSKLKKILYDRPNLFSFTIVLYRVTVFIFLVALGFSGVVLGTFWCRGTTLLK